MGIISAQQLPERELRLARIYTRTGDDGTTGLIGGKRVSKDSPPIEACGSLDELNALLGVVRSQTLPDGVDKLLQLVQEHLFTIGAELATPEGSERRGKEISDIEVQRLESEIDSLEGSIPPLRNFILPGGASAGAKLHLARAVARRAERQCVSLSRFDKVNPQILRYLNRLSDLLFVLARHVNQRESVPEQYSIFGKLGD
jgi:cob(I)alamin adenosyltransferase